MFNHMGDMAVFPDPLVARTTYDDWFEEFIGPKDSWLYDYFNQSWDITFQEVDIPIIGPTEAAVWTLTMWGKFNLFRDSSPVYSCPSPCPYSSGPFTLPPA